MNRLQLSRLTLLWGIGLLLTCTSAVAEERPNILLVMVDDMGYSDLGCYGGEIRTPTLDALAENGVRFARFYNCAQCCPTRASLMTGLYPHQAGVGDMNEEGANNEFWKRVGSPAYRPEDADSIQAMLDEYHSRKDERRQILALSENETLTAVAYYAPKEFTDRVWELLMIAVSATRQRRGLGSEVLRAVEESIRAVNGRLLLIETSDKSSFERTRLFYQKHGYTEVARIPDYFTDGDGKVSFVKRL